MDKTNQTQAVFDLPKGCGDQEFRGTLVAQFLPQREFPGSDRRVLAPGDSRESNFGNLAGTDEPEPGAPQQVTQVRVFDIGAGAQSEFVAQQVAKIIGCAPVENQLI